MTQTSSAKQPIAGDKSPKLIRDTFSMPDSDYQLIAKLMKRLPAQAARSTKSEIVRAGLQVLYEMDDHEFSHVLTKVERLKTGRPAKQSNNANKKQAHPRTG
jgi:hypothetical protein